MSGEFRTLHIEARGAGSRWLRVLPLKVALADRIPGNTLSLLRQFLEAHVLRQSARRSLMVALVLAGCGPASPAMTPQSNSAASGARPAVIQYHEGEKRFLRGGTAPLYIKVDPVNTGSRKLMLGASDIPPGDGIGLHRHLREDEIIIITRGTARIQLGRDVHTAGPGSAIFIPQGICIALTNIGSDTVSNFFVFSSPGFEQVLRAISSAPGEPPKVMTPEIRAAAFQQGHAVANPPDC